MALKNLLAGAGDIGNSEISTSFALLSDRLSNGIQMDFEVTRMEPLFKDQAEYDAFTERHKQHKVTEKKLADYEGDCFLGIDAGSTTTKVALVGEDGSLLYSFYSSNNGSPAFSSTTGAHPLSDLARSQMLPDFPWLAPDAPVLKSSVTKLLGLWKSDYPRERIIPSDTLFRLHV